MKRIVWVIVTILILLPLFVSASTEKSPQESPVDTGAPATDNVAAVVHLVEAEGVINPVMAEYILGAISDGEKAGVEAVIIQMDTPGGLDLSMRDIIKGMLTANVPVVVYVAPGGSRAASAGVFISYAAHVAAMAPGTNMGSAHPVAMGGKEMDETMMKKVENDSAAYIKSIAKKRGRNAEWAEKAVRESVNVTADEAASLGVIDFIATDLASLLDQLDGMKVDLRMGEKTINTEGALIKTVEMGTRHSILKVISNPNVAYILMMIGMAGLYFELSNPGVIFPGVVGAISLILAFYSFQTLPVNYAGLLLIGLAAIFFIVEIQVVSFGLLTLAGIVSLIMGSLMLFDSQEPFMRVSLPVMLPTIVFIGAFCVLIGYYAVKIQRQGAVSGEVALVGELGTALADLTPGSGDGAGQVFVHGEYWKARVAPASGGTIKKDDKVKVVSVDGLTLTVKKG